MRVFLLHRDRDFEFKPALHDRVFDAMLTGNPWTLINLRREMDRTGKADSADAPRKPGTDEVLTQDLELDTLWNAMAGGDEFLFETAKRAVLAPLADPDAISYRQRVLTDCLEHAETIRELYDLAMEALDNERKAGGGFWGSDQPETTLHRSVNILTLHVDVLKRLRAIAEQQAEQFSSEGFARFFAMLRRELADDYLHTVEQHLRELQFRRGLLQSAELGKGDKARNYVVRRSREQRWTERLPFGNREPSYSFTIPPRDEAGANALEHIRASGLNQVANAVAQSADHIRSFFVALRLELAFYLGCLNLHELLTQKGEPTCFPEPVQAEQRALAAEGIYDACLALHLDQRTVGNDVAGDGTSLIMITGANQGGKSTLLRSLGLAQLMMQAGMFVGATSFRASVCTGVFTHYKREEDAAMTGGKLDEELARMSEIADEITPNSVLLCNESFASTNEREGSEIARQVVRAMLDRQIRVIFVTHMYDLASSYYDQQLDSALFLRAERQPDGRRTFKLKDGKPLPTSYGEDSYRRIFEDRNGGRAAAGRE
jgi:DNA mismatch repair ATPase MutS